MSHITQSLAQIVTAADPSAAAAQLAERFDSAAVSELVDARDARILIVDAGTPPAGFALAAAIRAAGGVARLSGTLVATVATGPMLAEVRRIEAALAPQIDALATALHNALAPPQRLRLRNRSIDIAGEARVMGILNVTPDSFYERVSGVPEAVERARGMAAAGAALVDIGGQSYAHWNAPVTVDEELRRVAPAVAAIVADRIDIALSIDTFRAGVADAALAAGAHLINDCSGLSDPELATTVARYDAALVVMHLKGELNVRAPQAYRYDDVMAEIVDFLYERTERARAAGVAVDSIAIDPGLEFGKEPETDLEILDRFGELTVLGYPILFASSRKSFIGRLFSQPAGELLAASLATAGLGIAAGARLLRAHDVAQTVQFARMYALARTRRRPGLAYAQRMPGTPVDAGNSGPAPAV